MGEANSYRPEIDGLRAVAVLSVLFYHVGFPWMPGGFIGVDVFFVISGYLITRLLVTELEAKGAIDFAAFYARRVRRIVPALAVTALLTLAASAIVLPPDLLVDTSKSVIAAIASISNFLFWSQSGYFDAENTLKPLLHTWSLGVEEQFYLIWPLLLLAAYRLGGVRGLPVLAVVTVIASLAASIAWLQDRSLIYYLLPYRAVDCRMVARVALRRCSVWL
jgi:peptidoglycan/LPS O-acetylase OafA/YrhL